LTLLLGMLVHLDLFRSKSKVKVIGQSSESQEENACSATAEMLTVAEKHTWIGNL